MKQKLVLFFVAIIFTCLVRANESEKIALSDWTKIEDKIEKLPIIEYPSMARSNVDWLINAEAYKANIGAGKDDKSLIISNGLVARIFRAFPNLATIDIVNQMTSESVLRAVSSEGEVIMYDMARRINSITSEQRGITKPKLMEQLRKISQEEFEYVYENAKARIKAHPEHADEQRKIIDKHPHYEDEKEALQAAIDMNNNGHWGCQIWAKIGKDEEYYFIEDYFIVSDDNIVKQAAEYIGMAHVFSA